MGFQNIFILSDTMIVSALTASRYVCTFSIRKYAETKTVKIRWRLRLLSQHPQQCLRFLLNRGTTRIVQNIVDD